MKKSDMAEVSRNTQDKIDQYTCSICLEVFENPFRVPCGSDHLYCERCLLPLLAVAEPSCPKCRETFNPVKVKQARDVLKEMKSVKVKCVWCGEEKALTKHREHLEKCTRVDRSLPEFKPVKATSQSFPSLQNSILPGQVHYIMKTPVGTRDLPNRCTFQCPYCGLKNLDCKDLIKHCRETHRNSTAQVVCPVCASMPWGDPNRKSSNFMDHLALRHQFEYDTYVDYTQDDDEMLQRAIQSSITGE